MISCWEYFQNCRLPIIVYGMGNGADKIINAFSSRGIAVSDVIASDGFVRGQSFRGFRVKTLAEVERLYGEFVIALAFGSCLPGVMEHIRAISEKHKLLAPSTPVFGEEIFDLDFARAHKNELYEAYGLLADDKSRRVYALIAEYLLTGELEPLFDSQSEKSEAFESILKLSQNENYFDLGAYRGDTISEFLNFSGNSVPPAEDFCGSITAFEPDAKTFKKLSAFAGNFKNTLLFNKGVWSGGGSMGFASRSGRNSAFDGNGSQIPVTCVDSVVSQTGRAPTYIKADIEGAELEMLRGAEKTLKSCKPKLNIALYHRTEDIFRLILEVHRLNSEYKLYVRHHPYIPFWDTNLYAV